MSKNYKKIIILEHDFIIFLRVRRSQERWNLNLTNVKIILNCSEGWRDVNLIFFLILYLFF